LCEFTSAAREAVPRFVVEILVAVLASAPAVLGALILAAPEVPTDPARVDLILGTVTRAEAFRLSAVLLLVSGIASLARVFAATILRTSLNRAADRLARVRVALTTATMAQLQLLLETRLRWASDGRVTVFVPSGDHFVIIARYSPTLSYRNEREEHRLGVGCLGRAWESGEDIGDELPDAQVDIAGWEAAMTERWGIPSMDLHALVMKPRLIVAVRIDIEDPPREELGVVVVETDRLRADPKDDRVLDPRRVAGQIRLDRSRFVTVLQGSGDLDDAPDRSVRGRIQRWLRSVVGVPE
jgi:hypothetical protein